MSIPNSISPSYKILWHDVALLHYRWKTYRELYAHGQARLDLLNNSAPLLFSRIETILIDDIVLNICRLTGPAKSCGKENLSLSHLIGLASSENETDLASELTDQKQDLDAKVKTFSDRRNQSIAHTDLNRALASDSDSQEKSMGFSRRNIEDALAGIRSIMNTVQLHYEERTTGFEFGLGGWTTDLITTLKKAAYLDELIEKGEVHRRDVLRGNFEDA